jgi:hypothetical protein
VQRAGGGFQFYSGAPSVTQPRPAPFNSGSGFNRGSPNRGFLPASNRLPSSKGGTVGSGRGGLAGASGRGSGRG